MDWAEYYKEVTGLFSWRIFEIIDNHDAGYYFPDLLAVLGELSPPEDMEILHMPTRLLHDFLGLMLQLKTGLPSQYAQLGELLRKVVNLAVLSGCLKPIPEVSGLSATRQPASVAVAREVTRWIAAVTQTDLLSPTEVVKEGRMTLRALRRLRAPTTRVSTRKNKHNP